MCAITSKIKDERGGALLITLIFLFSIGLIATSLITLLIADTKVRTLNMGERRAFYAAQSGIEYVLRSLNEYALSSNNLDPLDGYSENLDSGDNTTCQILLNKTGTDEFTITSTGYSSNYAKKCTKVIQYIDVANYAVYASGNVDGNVKTSPSSGKIYENASFMPIFDQDELRDLAKPLHYYTGNLNLTWLFNFSRKIAYVEGDLSFGSWAWLNAGGWVVGGDTELGSYLSLTSGAFYHPNPGSILEYKHAAFILSGGMIVNGQVIGKKEKILFWTIYSTVYHDRSRMTDLLQYSVNGGPLVFTSFIWNNN